LAIGAAEVYSGCAYRKGSWGNARVLRRQSGVCAGNRGVGIRGCGGGRGSCTAAIRAARSYTGSAHYNRSRGHARVLRRQSGVCAGNRENTDAGGEGGYGIWSCCCLFWIYLPRSISGERSLSSMQIRCGRQGKLGSPVSTRGKGWSGWSRFWTCLPIL
jgi:hypothetical protein